MDYAAITPGLRGYHSHVNVSFRSLTDKKNNKNEIIMRILTMKYNNNENVFMVI